jgi:hypothetical protein
MGAEKRGEKLCDTPRFSAVNIFNPKIFKSILFRRVRV